MLLREQGAFIQEPVNGAPPSSPRPPPLESESESESSAPGHGEVEGEAVQEKKIVIVHENGVVEDNLTLQDLEKQSRRQNEDGAGEEVT